MLLDTRVLSFVAAVEAGSLSAAAKGLLLSAVSVKKQVDSLESEAGVKLLDRTNRGVAPTAAGSVLFEAARRMAQLEESALHDMRAAAGSAKPMVRVGASLLRPCSRLLETWSRVGSGSGFGIEVVAFDDNSELGEVVGRLGSRIDCIVGPCDAPAWHETCNVLKLGFYDCKVAVPRNHRLAGKASLTWNDLDGQSLMLVKEGVSPVLDSIRREIADRHPGIEVVDAPDAYSIETFNECERSSILMETLDAWDNVHPGFVSLPMDWAYRIPYGLLYPKRPSPAVARFVEELAASAVR